ncbi:hypothetical protein CP10881SC42_0522 [Chlamydia avium]|uniref:Uncharacterized protein n=1 Tax=Chlamydia avium TaxID=1457141 RepID=A0ABP2X661_9CHLA|nr:hypothetical protein CP10743SC13_0434 [Chlamydia psittaci 10_743_SC13]EPP38314.1 hypothetical protein CP10881SC42_0522 [Chlamydia avium]
MQEYTKLTFNLYLKSLGANSIALDKDEPPSVKDRDAVAHIDFN